MIMSDQEQQKITLGPIISWGLGLFLGVGGLGLTLEGGNSIAVGIMCMIASAFLLPPIRKRAYNATGKELSTGVRTMIVLGILMVGGTMMPQNANLSLETVETSNNTSVAVQTKPQAPEMPEPVKAEIINRCKAEMGEHGSMMVKGCIDQDIKAYKNLQKYDSSANGIIQRCKSQMLDYGWTMVKGCADQDIKAQKAIDRY